MSITTVERVKAVLGIPAGVTFYDGSIAQAVDLANGYVLSVLEQPGGLALHTRVEYLQAASPGQRYVRLTCSPVASVVALTHEGDALAVGVDAYVDDLGALHAHPRGRVANWSTEPGSIEITYLHGYTAETLPSELRGAADAIAAHAHARGLRAGSTEQRAGAGGITFIADPSGIPTTAAEILRRYERSAH